MYVDLEAYLEQLVDEESPKAVDGRLAQHLFPELRAFKAVDGLIRWCASGANEHVTSAFVIKDSEGRVWMLPYMETVGIVIHSDPPMICVGRSVEQGFGIHPEPGWEDVVAQFPRRIQVMIQDYLNEHPPILW